MQLVWVISEEQIYLILHFFTSPTGSGEEQIQHQNRPSTPANNPRPVLSEIQYVSETLPPRGRRCSTRGTSTLLDSSQKTNSDSSFTSLIQMLLDQEISRRNRTKQTKSSTAKKAATVPPTGIPRKKRIRRVRTRHSRRESPETEDFDTSSSAEYSDY
uniref:ORF3 n=1 Tax=Giant panda anellovirus TaxID=2016460 RepID=A0A220IGL7_9VIRU|nr:ORF3 [Giant panda anellovirus]